MTYTAEYASPVGKLLLAGDEIGLWGLWINEAKYFADGLPEVSPKGDLPLFKEVFRWLDIYFSGREPDFTPTLHLIGSDFRIRVWKELLKIPYGKTTTYGAIAKELSCGGAQAVGGAVGHNKISIIVPCHRVLGADGSLTGYAGGLDKKIFLLNTEGIALPRKYD